MKIEIIKLIIGSGVGLGKIWRKGKEIINSIEICLRIKSLFVQVTKKKKKSITFDECDNSKSVKLNLVSIGQHISGVKGKRTFWMWHIRCEIDWWEIFLNGQFIQQRSYNRPSLFMIEWCYLVVILQIKDTKIQRQTCLEMLHVWFITVELTQPAILFPFKCCHENWTVVREM